MDGLGESLDDRWRKRLGDVAYSKPDEVGVGMRFGKRGDAGGNFGEEAAAGETRWRELVRTILLPP